jgi:hypothetical protein
MYSAIPVLRSIGLHVLPGIFLVILAALLLGWWEVRRLTGTGKTGVDRWLPATAVALAVISFVLIAVRFIVVD